MGRETDTRVTPIASEIWGRDISTRQFPLSLLSAGIDLPPPAPDHLPRLCSAAKDASQPSPITVEVMDAPTPQADVVAGRVTPVVVQASTAHPRKCQGNFVVQIIAPAAVAAIANPVQAVPIPLVKMHKVAG